MNEEQATRQCIEQALHSAMNIAWELSQRGIGKEYFDAAIKPVANMLIGNLEDIKKIAKLAQEEAGGGRSSLDDIYRILTKFEKFILEYGISYGYRQEEAATKLQSLIKQAELKKLEDLKAWTELHERPITTEDLERFIHYQKQLEIEWEAVTPSKVVGEVKL